jgi:hypothetical protein
VARLTIRNGSVVIKAIDSASFQSDNRQIQMRPQLRKCRRPHQRAYKLNEHYFCSKRVQPTHGLLPMWPSRLSSHMCQSRSDSSCSPSTTAASAQARTAANKAAKVHGTVSRSDALSNNANCQHATSGSHSKVTPQSYGEQGAKVQSTTYNPSEAHAEAAPQEAERLLGHPMYVDASEPAVADLVDLKEQSSQTFIRDERARKSVMDLGPVSETTARVLQVRACSALANPYAQE